MNTRTPRRLAFEILEPKASPSALLLALAPLDEPNDQANEAQPALYATSTDSENVELLRFIERHTGHRVTDRTHVPTPTQAQVAAADAMMRATDTDLRATLIAELLEASSAESATVYSVLQF